MQQKKRPLTKSPPIICSFSNHRASSASRFLPPPSKCPDKPLPTVTIHSPASRRLSSPRRLPCSTEAAAATLAPSPQYSSAVFFGQQYYSSRVAGDYTGGSTHYGAMCGGGASLLAAPRRGAGHGAGPCQHHLPSHHPVSAMPHHAIPYPAIPYHTSQYHTVPYRTILHLM